MKAYRGFESPSLRHKIAGREADRNFMASSEVLLCSFNYKEDEGGLRYFAGGFEPHPPLFAIELGSFTKRDSVIPLGLLMLSRDEKGRINNTVNPQIVPQEQSPSLRHIALRTACPT